MKNRFFRNSAILFILMASIFANAGCSSDETGDTSNTGKAYLRFSLSGDSARTIVPTDVTESEINKVELKCTKSGSEVTVFNSTWNSIYEMYYDTIHEIEVGVYDFSLYLYVNDRLCQKASITERIISAGTNTLNFTAAYVEDGYGDLSLTLQWDSNSRVGYVKAGLYELDATTPVNGCYEETLTVLKNGYAYIVYKKYNLLKGNYFVIFKLYDSDGTLLNTVSDIVKIESALVTTKTDFVNDINTRYTITYDCDYGEWVEGYEPPRSFNSNTAVVLPTAKNIRKPGYEFSGWYYYGATKPMTKISLGAEGDIKLHARWEKITIELSRCDTNVIVGTNIVFNISFEGLEEVPKTVDVYIDGENEAFASNVPVVEGKITIPNSGMLSSPTLYVKYKDATSNLLSLGMFAMLNEDGSYTFDISSITGNTVLLDEIFKSNNEEYTFNIIGCCNYSGCRDAISNIRIVSGSFNINLNLSYISGEVKIDDRLFKEWTNLVAVSIPKIATYLGYESFSGCTSLTNITIPESVTAIESCAFSGCTSLINITIPESVTAIGSGAFSGCTSLTNITIPKGVTAISDESFSGCTSLTNIIIPESVITIGKRAFHGCIGLTKVVIPKNVTSIGDRVFSDCENLVDVKISEGVPIIGKEMFFGLKNLTSIIIPNSMTVIGDSAFSGSGLENVIIPEHVTTVGDNAFSGCTSLTKIVIPKSVTLIGDNAFYYCINLIDVKISQGLTVIGKGMFKDCKKLSNICIPHSMISIGDSAFSGTGLESVIIPDNVTTLGEKAFSGCANLTTVSIPDGITTISDEIFSGCINLTIINIPENVTAIGAKAFSGCTSLTTISIPKGVTVISHEAFSECTSLKSISIPKGVTSIGYMAFFNSGLTSIDIPENVILIGQSVFSDCKNLVDVKISSVKTTIESQAFKDCANLKNIWLPEIMNDISIGRKAFSGCTSLTRIEIPQGLTGIAMNVFENCTSLTEVIIPNSVTRIGESAFMGCSNLKNITIPENMIEIQGLAFYDTGLTSAIFLNTSGWRLKDKNIDSELADPSNAAQLLKKGNEIQILII